MTDTTMDLDITRDFAACRDHVWAAFTDEDAFCRWFGPEGWHVPRESADFDLRPGGHQRFVMVSDEDAEQRSPADGEVTEVTPGEAFAAEESYLMADGTEATLRMRVTFEDAGAGTRIRLRQGPHGDMAEAARAGWESSFGKLDRLLAETAGSRPTA
jgi:uncharacterized protein YndB with AHSA1/START domain